MRNKLHIVIAKNALKILCKLYVAKAIKNLNQTHKELKEHIKFWKASTI
jgi:hypothetical protein